MLYHYSKNTFYYKYALNNIKAGNDQFSMPTKPSVKEVHSNMYILKLFDEHFVTTCFQDLNRKTLSINVGNSDLIASYKDHLGGKISTLVQRDSSEQLYAMYGDLLSFVPQISKIIHESDFFLSETKIAALKENMYTLDLRLRQEALQFLRVQDVDFSDTYSELVMMGIFATLRETFFGFLLYLRYISNQEDVPSKDEHIQTLQLIYLQDILLINQEYVQVFLMMIEYVRKRYDSLLGQWLQIDENEQYLELAWNNWIEYAESKEKQVLLK